MATPTLARTAAPLRSRAAAAAAIAVRPATSRSFASSSSASSSSSDNNNNLPVANPTSLLSRTANTLLPPLPLYRRLLRAHRHLLSYEMRSLGDTYVKDEFKRHKAVTNPLQIVGFLGQWKVYLDQLEAGGVNAKGGEERAKFEGRRLKEEEFSKLSEEQLYQLHEFMTATQELYDPSAPGGPGAPTPQDGAAATSTSSPSSPLSPGDPNAEGTTGGNTSGDGDGMEGRKVIQDILDSSAPKDEGGKGR